MLDKFIDKMAASSRVAPGRDPKFGPFGSVGSTTNVVLGAVLLVFSVAAGLTSTPVYFVLTAAAAAMEFVFVRIMVRARRGDFTAK
ncbi:MAG: hypothetical protein ABL886_11180 [Rhodoglobus sp.]